VSCSAAASAQLVREPKALMEQAQAKAAASPLRCIRNLIETYPICRAAPPPAPSWYVSPEELMEQARAKAAEAPPTPEAELKSGNFGAIRSLLRVLASGAESKAALDIVIDSCR